MYKNISYISKKKPTGDILKRVRLQKKRAIFLLVFALLLPSIPAMAETEKKNDNSLSLQSVSAVLIEGSTGQVIYEKDKDKQMIPASITKIMTLNLIFEAIDSGKIKLNDTVTVSEYAAKMGGSQVYLEPGETQTVTLSIKGSDLAFVNSDGQWVLEQGDFRMQCGNQVVTITYK